jgi:fatty acid synthase
MLATGKLPPDALPGDLAGQDCILGLEFSGRNCEGKRVMGMVAARGLATTVLADPGFLWEVPDKWTLEEAATIPVVYSTVSRTPMYSMSIVTLSCGISGCFGCKKQSL